MAFQVAKRRAEAWEAQNKGATTGRKVTLYRGMGQQWEKSLRNSMTPEGHKGTFPTEVQDTMCFCTSMMGSDAFKGPHTQVQSQLHVTNWPAFWVIFEGLNLRLCRWAIPEVVPQFFSTFFHFNQQTSNHNPTLFTNINTLNSHNHSMFNTGSIIIVSI